MKSRYKRTIIFTQLSIAFAFAMVIGKLLFGIFFLSSFIVLSAIYSFGIGLAKLLALLTHQKSIKKVNRDGQIEYGREEYNCYLYVGIIVIAASVAYIVYSMRLLLGLGSSGTYPDYIAINIAAVTFAEIAFSVRGAVLARRDKEPVMEAIKLSSVASSLILLTLTQTALLSFAQTSNLSRYNGLSGVIFGFLAAIIGLYMTISVTVKINKLTLQEQMNNKIEDNYDQTI